MGLDAAIVDGDSVLASSFSHKPSNAATATLRPVRDFLMSAMSMDLSLLGDVGKGREVVRGGGLRTAARDGCCGCAGAGNGGKGTEGGGPDGAIARAHGLVGTVAGGFGGGCGCGTLAAGGTCSPARAC